MPKVGRQTWIFPQNPRILATGTAAGKTECEGPLGDLFDIRHTSDRIDDKTWEQSEQVLFDEASNVAVQKIGISSDAIDLMIGGDLNAQLSSFYFGLRTFSIPTLGVYSACASICQALAIGAMTIDAGYAEHVLAGTSSHNSTAERQFRYPTEYGAQKPPTAQRTVTGAGVALLGKSGSNIAIPSATIGQVVDYGITSPWEMGAAMAPAAYATITAHLAATNTTPEDYDCIATGDLGRIGHAILVDLFTNKGVKIPHLTDCGMLIYQSTQSEVFSGGSGGACCSLVTFSYLIKKLQTGDWKRILVSATGALLSSVTAQQGESIPSISHAVVLERKDDRV